MSEYVVIYEQSDDGGWGAYLPDLPGVVALGATRAEAAERIKEALSAYSADLARSPRRSFRWSGCCRLRRRAAAG
jgi:predicted RNase H-like HicB family nuclease